ncbi:MAG: carboxypeptidase-like regulatory domain-containing protein [Acidobacteria bacterium]|nr:carboxypeptidase-like regulatory domain-containing protein [Acidobacteriota bacterium]
MRIEKLLWPNAILSGAVCAALLLISNFILTNAQQGGTITGRVVNDEGTGVPNMALYVNPAPTGLRDSFNPGNTMVVTDEDGNFRATGLTPSLYTINVFQAKEYTMQPLNAAERREQRYYRTGDNVSITLVRGGVITGKITNSDGQPIVGVQVAATMVRESEGFPVRQSSGGGRARATDDRGIYRLFGLSPGTYIVSTNGRMMYYGASPYDGNVTTYHPSSTRDTATEVTVNSGGEMTGIDIRFRGERGRVVSGAVTNAAESSPTTYTYVTLISTPSGGVTGSSNTRTDENNKGGFAITGVTDGEYDVFAISSGNEGIVAHSATRRVTVNGADVTGIELRLSPLASVSGQLLIETSTNPCESKSKGVIEEIMIYARNDDPSSNASLPSIMLMSNVVPNEKGEFTLPKLLPSRYRLETRLPNEDWFTKSIALPASTAARRPQAGISLRDISRTGLELKSGDTVTGIKITIATGAAGLRGKVIAEKEGASLPSRLRVHLVPVESALANDALRYSEVLMNNDGTFAFTNLAPGKYWLLTRPVPNDEPVDRPPRPPAWDNTERAKLRLEAETKKVEFEPKPCQRLSDITIKY